MSLAHKLKVFAQQKRVKTAAPFILLLGGGWFIVKEFATVRYEFRRQTEFTPETAKEHGIEMKKPGEVTIETEYEKLKELKTDEWENVRIVRPWDENPEANKS